MPPSQSRPGWLACESLFYFFCFTTTVVCLLTLVFAQFSSLFSVRMSLRGDSTSVEDAVMKCRGEYKLALAGLVLGVELFIASIPFIGFYKLKVFDAGMGCVIIFPALYVVVYMFKRSEEKFKVEHAFGSAREGGDIETGAKNLQEMLEEVDRRNDFEQVPSSYTAKGVAAARKAQAAAANKDASASLHRKLERSMSSPGIGPKSVQFESERVPVAVPSAQFNKALGGEAPPSKLVSAIGSLKRVTQKHATPQGEQQQKQQKQQGSDASRKTARASDVSSSDLFAVRESYFSGAEVNADPAVRD